MLKYDLSFAKHLNKLDVSTKEIAINCEERGK